MLPKIELRSASRIVYEELKKAIITRSLQAGAPLVERDLAELMGVSRTPVHEAINRLESEQLVLRLPNKRAAVAEISLNDLMQLYTIRTALEVLAVRWGMPHMTPEVIAKLKKNLSRMKQYGEADDLERVAQMNAEFHRIIMETAQSRHLTMFLEKIHDSVRLFRIQSVHTPNRVGTIIRDHGEIIRTFENRDVEGAIQHISEHLQSALEALLSQYRQTQGAPVSGTTREERSE
jgi:DNA-binding GntR family transcriptional regulator